MACNKCKAIRNSNVALITRSSGEYCNRSNICYSNFHQRKIFVQVYSNLLKGLKVDFSYYQSRLCMLSGQSTTNMSYYVDKNEYVAVEVRKQTLYRKLILKKWCLKFPNDFDAIVDVVLDCLLYASKTFNGHSARLCFMCVRRCIE